MTQAGRHYVVLIVPSALKELVALPKKPMRQVDEMIKDLATDPRPPWSRKLKGRAQGLHRVDSGDFRAIYAIDDRGLTVTVTKIGNRRDVYRGL